MDSDQNRFMRAQIRRIELDKWYEGVEKKRDPGAEYVFHWIGTKAVAFRRQWETSKCQCCSNSNDCGHSVKPDCSDFDPA